MSSSLLNCKARAIKDDIDNIKGMVGRFLYDMSYIVFLIEIYAGNFLW